MQSNVDVGPGVERFFGMLAQSLGVSFAETADKVLSRASPLSDLIGHHLQARLDFRRQIGTMLSLQLSDLTPLASESHHRGSHVLHDRENHRVIYANRTRPTAFTTFCSWYSAEFGRPNFSRTTTPLGNDVFSRPYITGDIEVSDTLETSHYCGELTALAWFTSTTDLHDGNLICSEGVPVVLDDECCAHPLRPSQVAQLDLDRKHYASSPFRSLLVQESGLVDRKAKQGVGGVVGTNLDQQKFLDGFWFGVRLLKNRANDLSDVANEIEKSESIRYLVRSTEFYEWCIVSVCSDLFFGRSWCETIERLKSRFATESSLFPELSECIDEEMDQLSRLCVPYWMNRFHGTTLFTPYGQQFSGNLVSPRDWCQQHISRLCALNDDDVAAYVKLF